MEVEIATVEWGGSLAGEVNGERWAERGVLVVEMLRANEICDRCDTLT